MAAIGKYTLTLDAIEGAAIGVVHIKNPHTADIMSIEHIAPGESIPLTISQEQTFTEVTNRARTNLTMDAALPLCRDGGAKIKRRGHRDGSYIVRGRTTFEAEGKIHTRDSLLYCLDGEPLHEYIPIPFDQMIDDWEIVGFVGGGGIENDADDSEVDVPLKAVAG